MEKVDRDRLAELLSSDELQDEAVREAVRIALLEHKAIGNPIALWENGKVVIVQPEDIRVA